VSLAALNIIKFYKNAVKIADFGGEYTEGNVGQPRYINPALASANDIDSDLCELIFSGLFKYSSEGKIIGDAAEKWEISEDKKTYTIYLKNNIFWHDGKKMTSKDVYFTAQILSNPAYKSPLRESLQSIECQTDGDYIIKFILKNPYALFLNNLTFKILPEHIWKNIPPTSFPLEKRNLKPIGSGPFQLKKLSMDSGGFIHYIKLEKFENYFSQKPLLQYITFYFYASDDELFTAYNKKEILGMNKLPVNWQKKIQNPESVNLFKTKLPQYFSIFLNQTSNKALQDKNVRAALSMAADRDKIIKDIFGETAEKIDTIPLFNAPVISSQNSEQAALSAANLLEQSGWIDFDNDGIREKNGEKLEFSLFAASYPPFMQIAEILKSSWSKIGANIIINIKTSSEINKLIENRSYDALLFGQILGTDPDPYAFWHSSQKNYPGLNLSLFSNPNADKLLEQIRTSFDADEKNNLYAQLQNIISQEIPAIFLFKTVRLFGVNKKIQSTETQNNNSQNRFANIIKWYIRTKYERRNKNISRSN